LLSQFGNSVEQNEGILAKKNEHNWAIRYEVIMRHACGYQACLWKP
jgi:hypothetical protein